MDPAIYEKPTCIDVQLTHRHVVLDYFKDKKPSILQLHSGMKLSLIQMIVNNEKQYFLSAVVKGKQVYVAKISNQFRHNIENFARKGYLCREGEVHYVVAWRGENDESETAVLLPILHFRHE